MQPHVHILKIDDELAGNLLPPNAAVRTWRISVDTRHRLGASFAFSTFERWSPMLIT
jgi:hypothetical protein